MRIKLLTLAVGAAVGALAPSVHAEFALGDETKGITVKFSDEADMRVRVRLQPRLDFGDLARNSTTGQYESESDFYIRRARLEFDGRITKNLTYNLTLAADRSSQATRTANGGGGVNFDIHYAFLDYKFADPFHLRFGEYKLPLSRVSLTSSARQLLVERPASTEAAKSFFGDYEQTNLQAYGKFADGAFKYYLAIGDGSAAPAAGTATNATGVESDAAFVGRLEFSPPGWAEKGMSDAHLGKGRHLTFGLHTGQQKGLKSLTAATETDRSLLGADVSFHLGGFTAQAEYNTWKTETTGAADVEPEGWYVQLGYLIPGTSIEPAVRYEVFDRNSNATTDREDKITTAGFNWYFKGHSMKLGVNWVRTEFGRGNLTGSSPDDTQDVYQVQTQIYF
jgi:phosphate-selective porin OprO/OprP